MRHVLTAEQFDRDVIEQLCDRASELESQLHQRSLSNIPATQGRMMFSLFFEPSTRTRMSFGAAAHHLGMKVVGTENAREFSSAAKGESLEDTIRTLNHYHPAVIILRHFETGAAAKAAAVSWVPIINAGDGMGQHPTQALLDIYTIKRETGRADNLQVVLGGDLAHGRTARSLALLLAKYKGNTLVFLAPPGLEMAEDIKDQLTQQKMSFFETTDTNAALEKADVVYWTRVQKERFDSTKITQTFVIDRPEMMFLKDSAVLMHPLPRVDEITPEVDSDPRAAYFRQAGNGMLMRMALIEWVLSE